METLEMGAAKNADQDDADAALEREIREGRKFTLEEAIGRMVGPGGMKGESPVARMRQAEIEIESWLGQRLVDSGGGLKLALNRRVKASEQLLNGYDQPLVVLADFCRHVCDSEYLLAELVREADIEWARSMDERPYLNKAGAPHHPDDPYTAESVRWKLSDLQKQLSRDGQRPQGDSLGG
jgi:hypothetical protein